MKLPRRQFLQLAASAAALPVARRIAAAQSYPSRPLTMVVPYPAGGPTDAVARILAEGLRPLLGQPVMIENVSGGGARLDFGMVAFTDTAWMDDRTSPASHVRHNIEGLSFAFPPAYLLSFLIDADGEPIAGAEDLPLLVRSRGAGILGLTYRTDLLDDDTAERLKEQIAEYKTYRTIVAPANALLLSAQAPIDSTRATTALLS